MQLFKYIAAMAYIMHMINFEVIHTISENI